MDPAQERAKREAEDKANRRDYADQKFAPAKCLACKGRGCSLYGRFPTLLTCHVCNGSGRAA